VSFACHVDAGACPPVVLTGLDALSPHQQKSVRNYLAAAFALSPEAGVLSLPAGTGESASKWPPAGTQNTLCGDLVLLPVLYITPCHITPCYITPCYITPCYITPCYIHPPNSCWQ